MLRRIVWKWCLGVAIGAVAHVWIGCGPVGDSGPTGAADADARAARSDAGMSGETSGRKLPYAASVESFSPGAGAGFGAEAMPEVVLGPPRARGVATPSEDVVSLGEEGTITLGFGERRIVDEEGADFVVFENAFYIGGNPDEVYRELGAVSVSRNGEDWRRFDCRSDSGGEAEWPGCAGWRPTKEYDPTMLVPLEPDASGGDPFDLSDVGLDSVRYVRIRSLSDRGGNGKVGFDLDAVGLVHWERASR